MTKIVMNFLMTVKTTIIHFSWKKKQHLTSSKFKKIISNALTIHVDNYYFNNTTQEDQLLNISAIEEVFEEMISNLRPLQLKAYNMLRIILQIIRSNWDYF